MSSSLRKQAEASSVPSDSTEYPYIQYSRVQYSYMGTISVSVKCASDNTSILLTATYLYSTLIFPLLHYLVSDPVESWGEKKVGIIVLHPSLHLPRY